MSSLSPFLEFRQLHVLDLLSVCIHRRLTYQGYVFLLSSWSEKSLIILFYFSQFDICKIVYCLQLVKDLFSEGCRVERREATSMSFSKRGHGW